MKSLRLLVVLSLATFALVRVADAQTKPAKFYVPVHRGHGYSAGAQTDQFVTFSVPVQVPGKILPPGKYLFTFAAPTMVQVMTPDRSHVLTAFFVTLADRPPLGKSEARFQSIRPDLPLRLIAYYPAWESGFQPHYRHSERASVYATTTVAAK